MFRRSGYRFADKNMRQMKEFRAYSDSVGTEYALKVAGATGLFAVVLPSLADPIGIAGEAGLEQLDLVRRDGPQVAQRRRVDRALGVLLHLQAVEKHLGHAVDRDDAAMSAQQAVL